MEPKEGETDKYLLSVEANPTLNERIITIFLGVPYGTFPFVHGELVVIQEGNVLAKISTDQEKVNFKTLCIQKKFRRHTRFRQRLKHIPDMQISN